MERAIDPAPRADLQTFSPRGTGSGPRATLLCFSHLRWGFVWQRPQHLLTRAVRRYDVLFVEEPVFRSGVTPHLEIFDQPSGVRVILPVMPDGLASLEVDRTQHGLLRDLLAKRAAAPLIVWYYTPMAMAFSADVAADLCIYDNMDELSAFRGASPEMLANEAALFARSDLVFTGGRSLYEAKRARHASVHLFPSSIEFGHFAAARGASVGEPADQAGIARPRLGFAGVIDERMDIELVGALAGARPDWQLVMIGPVVKIDPARLPGVPNIHWLGPRSYAELPSYMAGWDVALMPFALNESTRFISPTKTPEYLAAGLPVVSTPIADVVSPYGERGLVEIAATPAEFVARVEALLTGPGAGRRERADAFLAGGSWDLTWSAMHALIESRLEHARRPESTAPRRAILAETIAATSAQ